MATPILQCICTTPVLYMRTGYVLYKHLLLYGTLLKYRMPAGKVNDIVHIHTCTLYMYMYVVITIASSMYVIIWHFLQLRTPRT